MRFNLGKPTKDEEYGIYNLLRSGNMRYTLDYCAETLCTSNDFGEIIKKLREHHQQMLIDDVSLITDFEIDDYYEIYDLAARDSYTGYQNCIKIDVADLNRQAFMHQFYGDVAKPVKKTTKKAAATKE